MEFVYGSVVYLFVLFVAFMSSDVQSAIAPLRCDGRSPPAVVVVVASAVVVLGSYLGLS